MVFWRVHALYLSADSLIYVTALSVISYYGNSAQASPKLNMYSLHGDDVVSHVTSVLGNPKDNYDISVSVFVVQFNGFMSLTS